MHVRVTGDTDATSGLGPIIDSVSGPIRKSFLTQDYGADLLGIVIVLMCQDPSLKLKQRTRFSKGERKLYLDVMLSLDHMQSLDPEGRSRIVGEKTLAELRSILKKYAFTQFDTERFLDDFQQSWGRSTAYRKVGDEQRGRTGPFFYY